MPLTNWSRSPALHPQTGVSLKSIYLLLRKRKWYGKKNLRKYLWSYHPEALRVAIRREKRATNKRLHQEVRRHLELGVPPTNWNDRREPHPVTGIVPQDLYNQVKRRGFFRKKTFSGYLNGFHRKAIQEPQIENRLRTMTEMELRQHVQLLSLIARLEEHRKGIARFDELYDHAFSLRQLGEAVNHHDVAETHGLEKGQVVRLFKNLTAVGLLPKPGQVGPPRKQARSLPDDENGPRPYALGRVLQSGFFQPEDSQDRLSVAIRLFQENRLPEQDFFVYMMKRHRVRNTEIRQSLEIGLSDAGMHYLMKRVNEAIDAEKIRKTKKATTH